LAVLGMQSHVHGGFRIVDVADLALVACLDRMPREECEAVLLNEGPPRPELLGILEPQLLERSLERLVAVRRAMLIYLPVRRNSCDLWLRSHSVREWLPGQYASRRDAIQLGLPRGEGVTQGP